MEWVIVSSILFILTVILAVRQFLMRRELKNITSQLGEIIDGDTNTLILCSGNFGALKSAVKTLNGRLSDLRKKELAIKSKNTEIGNAITSISHDLRTPLTAISGYVDLIRKSDSKTEKEKYIDIIGERTEAMKALTEELFHYSLVLSDEAFHYENVCLNSALEQALAAGFTLLSQKKINPNIDISGQNQYRRLDKNAFSRILENIISNAARYSDGDFSVSLDNNGVFEFRNSAHSLDEIQVSRLFDRFYTVSNARNSTGLGLSIAKSLTEKMNGEISASFSDGVLCIRLCFNEAIE